MVETDFEYKIQEWSREIDKVTEDFKNRFEGLSLEMLNWKFSSGKWSIAQNMDHLIVINRTYFPVISALKACTYQTPVISKIPAIVSFFGKAVLKASEPTRRKKRRTLLIWEPSQTQFTNEVFEKFADHQEELKKEITGSIELLRNGAIVSSPALRLVVYTLEMAFEIIVSHEKRHLAQATEVYDLLDAQFK